MVDYKVKLGSTAAAKGVAIDEGLRQYMLRVYNYMGTGLAITGLVAFFTANSPTLLNAIYGSPIRWLVFLAPLGMVFYLSSRMHKMTPAKAQTVFWIFAALMGLSLASIFIIYTGESIARVFFITAATFGAMSLYGYTTKRDLTAWRSFLIMGLIGLIIGIIVNAIFFESQLIDYLISVIGVIVFVGFTAYDTQKIKNTYDAVSHDGTLMAKSAIMGALKLYLDFLNLFIFLLHLLGARR